MERASSRLVLDSLGFEGEEPKRASLWSIPGFETPKTPSLGDTVPHHVPSQLSTRDLEGWNRSLGLLKVALCYSQQLLVPEVLLGAPVVSKLLYGGYGVQYS
jgi:hypothetical protein